MVRAGLTRAQKEALAVSVNVTSKNTPTYIRAFGAARMMLPHGVKAGSKDSAGALSLAELQETWSVHPATIKRAKRVLTYGHQTLVTEVEAALNSASSQHTSGPQGH